MYNSIQEVEVNETFMNALEDAGASKMFRRIVALDEDSLPAGVERNSVRQEARKHCYWADHVSAQVFKEKKHYGGHFYEAAWDGNVERAFGRADGNNQAILEQLGYRNRVTP